MKLAIMQPYLFPYLAYFQLVNTVDKFVNYDDVSFIKKGWINRNNVLSHGKPFLFSIPVSDISSFRPINKTMTNERLYAVWKKKFFKTLNLNYNKAPYYSKCIAILEAVFSEESEYISHIAFQSIKETCRYLDIETDMIESSAKYENSELKGTERVLDICYKEGASDYINPIGGEVLYNKGTFLKHNINLYFLKSKPIEYNQLNKTFVPDLSIIDVMMYNPKEKIKELLNEFELV